MTPEYPPTQPVSAEDVAGARRVGDKCSGSGIVTRRFRREECGPCGATGIIWVAPGYDVAAAYRRIFEERPDALLIDRLIQHLKSIGACDGSSSSIEEALGIEQPVESSVVVSDDEPVPWRTLLAGLLARFMLRLRDPTWST